MILSKMFKHAVLTIVLATVLHACALPNAQKPIPDEVETIFAEVDVSDQEMRVEINGELHFVWDVSTARPGKSTPRGTYGAYWLSRDHVSSIYADAPMPFAIFFKGDYAVHGTLWESQLGTPASAGCIRLSNENAELLFDLVEKHGQDTFTITLKD